MKTLVDLLRDPRGRFLVALPVVIVLAVVIGLVVRHQRNELDPPSTAASEHDLEQGVGSSIGERVGASCQRPSSNGWTCLLRAADGRYGYATGQLSGIKHIVRGYRTYTYTSTDAQYSWGFYVAAGGGVDLASDPGGGDGTADQPSTVEIIAYAGSEIAAISVAARAPDVSAFSCPALSVGATVTCQITGAAPVQIQRTGASSYRVRTQQPLPGAADYQRDPALPAIPAV